MRKSVLLVLLASCVPAANGPSVDTTFGSYVRAIRNTGHAMGSLPKSLEMPPIDSEYNKTAFTSPPMWSRGVVFDGFENDEICFKEWESNVDLDANAEELGKDHFDGLDARVELLTELPTGRALWPSKGAKLEYKNVAEDETKVVDGITRVRTVYWRQCAPLQAVANARYLAVIVHHTTPIGHSYPDDELLLWELR